MYLSDFPLYDSIITRINNECNEIYKKIINRHYYYIDSFSKQDLSQYKDLALCNEVHINIHLKSLLIP